MPGWALALLGIVGGSVIVGLGAKAFGADATQTGQAVGVYLAGWAMLGLGRLWRWAWHPIDWSAVRNSTKADEAMSVIPMSADRRTSAIRWLFAGVAVALAGVIGGRALVSGLAGLMWDWGLTPVSDVLYVLAEHRGLVVIGALISLWGAYRLTMLRFGPE